MKQFSLFLLLLFFTACDSKINTDPKAIKWDREICERCKMIISVRNYTVQVINPTSGKRYYFDDIGCTVLWFDEDKIEWENDAIIYVSDAKSGEWLDAKKSFWTYGAITPMAFGYSAFATKQDGKENFDYNYVRDRILGKPL